GYAQYNIAFDGRPPFPGDPGVVQMREWAVANEFPQHAGALLLMSENPMSGAESLGEFNGRLVSLVMYYHARNVLAALSYANKPQRIIEIGGSYDEIARMWLKNPIAPTESFVSVKLERSPSHRVGGRAGQSPCDQSISGRRDRRERTRCGGCRRSTRKHHYASADLDPAVEIHDVLVGETDASR